MTKAKLKIPASALLPLCAVVLCVLSLSFYGDGWKVMTLLVSVAAVVYLILARKRVELTLTLLAVALYMLLCAVSALGAVSGKFFIKEYSKLLLAFFVFLLIVLSKDKEKTVRRAAVLVAAMSAFYALVSVELGSTGLLIPIYRGITGYDTLEVGFEAGTRLTGAFGNANVLAGLLAIGFFLAVFLLEDGKASKFLSCVCQAFCAFGFVLAFSMGGFAVFALSVVLYVAVAGKQRGSVLLRMAGGFGPAAILAFVAFPFFGQTGATAWLPLFFMVLSAAVACLLEKLVYPRLAPFFQDKKRAAVTAISVLAVVLAYIALAMAVAGPYHYDSEGTLHRSAYLKEGWHSMDISADGYIGLTVYSQTDNEIMTQTQTTVSKQWLLSGGEAYFYVPEGSKVQHFSLWAKEGRDLNTVTIDGKQNLKLDYKLLPDFIANRLQGVLKNQNAVQRTVFFNDGMKLFAEKPLLGNGLGSFESAACSVQSYYYETKYVHNQYIQVLVDGGILGFAAYMAALVFMALALIKRRQSWGRLGPAMCACLLMIAGHSAEEVTMSLSVYLPAAYAVFGIITLSFHRPLNIRPFAAKLCHWVAPALYALFAVLITLNLQAAANVNASGGNYTDFMAALDSAAKSDPFEYNDYKISYVWNSLSSPTQAVADKAEKYADQLMDARSNSITGVLLQYRLEKGETEKAMACARFGALNNRSDPQVWNDYFGYLSEALTPEKLTPQLAAQVVELYETLEQVNTQLMSPVELNEANMEYIDAAKQAAKGVE